MSRARDLLMQQLMQSQMPQQNNEYMGAFRSASQPVQYSANESIGANAGASFIQGFSAGIFGSLAQERQAEIQTKQRDSLISMLDEYDRRDIALAQAEAKVKAMAAPPTQLGDFAYKFDPEANDFKPLAKTRERALTGNSAGANPWLPQQAQQQQGMAVPAPMSAPPIQQLPTAVNPQLVAAAGGVTEIGQQPARAPLTKAELIRSIGTQYAKNAPEQVANKMVPDDVKDLSKKMQALQDYDKVIGDYEELLPKLGATGSIAADYGNKALTQLGSDQARRIEADRRRFDGLSSTITQITKRQYDLTGGEGNTIEELRMLTGNVPNSAMPPEYNAQVLEDIKAKRDALVKQIDFMSGKAGEMQQQVDPALVESLGAQATPQPSAALTPDIQAQSIAAQNMAQEVLPKLNKESREYVTKNLKNYEGPLVISEVTDDIMRDLIAVESSGNPNAVSPKGARGLTQLMPKTLKEIEADLGRKIDMTNPNDQIAAGKHYLNKKLKEFDGNLPMALAAYNGGAAQQLKGGGTLGQWYKSAKKELGFDGTQAAQADEMPTTQKKNPLPAVSRPEVASAVEAANVPPNDQTSLTDYLFKAAGNGLLPLNSLTAAAEAAYETGSISSPEFKARYNQNRDVATEGTDRATEALKKEVEVPGLGKIDVGNLAFNAGSAVLDPVNLITGGGGSLVKQVGKGAVAGGVTEGGESLVDYLAGGKGTLNDVYTDTLKGGALGATGSAVFGAGGKVVGKVGAKISSSEKGAVRIAKDEGAELTAKARSTIAKRLSQLSPEQVSQAKGLVKEAADNGVPLSLADVLMESNSKQAQNFTRYLKNFSEASDEASKDVAEKVAKTGDRVKDYAAELAPKAVDPDNAISDFVRGVRKTLAKEKKVRSDAASPLYDAARNKMKTIEGDDVAEKLGDPIIETAIAKAKVNIKKYKDLPDNDIDLLQEARRVIRDDELPRAVRDGLGNQARLTRLALKDINEVINRNPDIAAADLVFREGSSAINKLTGPQFKTLEATAEKNGEKVAGSILSQSTKSIKDFMQILRPDNADEIRGLVRAHIVTTVDKTPDLTTSASPLKALIGSESQREKLRAVLGAGKDTDKLMRRMELEAIQVKGSRKLYEGSSTFSNVSEGAKDLLGKLPEAKSFLSQLGSGNLVGASLTATAGVVRHFINKNTDPKLQKEILAVMLKPGRTAEEFTRLSKTIARLQKQQATADVIAKEIRKVGSKNFVNEMGEE